MITSPIRILTIGPDYRYPNGGIAKLINTYSKFFENFEFVSTMRAPKHGKETKVKTFFRMINGLFSMSYKIFFKRYRIVHIHTASGISFLRESLFLYLASFLGAKTILHMHSGSLVEFYESHPKLVGRCVDKADMVITIAKVWETFLRKKGHNNVITIGNPIDIPHQSNNSENGVVKILFMGLICDNKGIWDILEMIKSHRCELIGKIKLIVGGNGEVERLQEFIAANKLEDLIEYAGWIDGDKKTEILSDIDIYLQPSYREALGIAILEAMSYKIPIIASNSGGIPEIVHNGENGYLVQAGDKEGLFNALKKLINSRDQRKIMGEKGYEMAKSFYPDTIKTKLINLYSYLSKND